MNKERIHVELCRYNSWYWSRTAQYFYVANVYCIGVSRDGRGRSFYKRMISSNTAEYGLLIKDLLKNYCSLKLQRSFFMSTASIQNKPNCGATTQKVSLFDCQFACDIHGSFICPIILCHGTAPSTKFRRKESIDASILIILLWKIIALLVVLFCYQTKDSLLPFEKKTS